MASELVVVAVKIVRWSRSAIMALRRPASSRADCPCRSLIFDISDICGAQKAGPAGEISTEEVGGTISPTMSVYAGGVDKLFLTDNSVTDRKAWQETLAYELDYARLKNQEAGARGSLSGKAIVIFRKTC